MLFIFGPISASFHLHPSKAGVQMMLQLRDTLQYAGQKSSYCIIIDHSYSG